MEMFSVAYLICRPTSKTHPEVYFLPEVFAEWDHSL